MGLFPAGGLTSTLGALPEDLLRIRECLSNPLFHTLLYPFQLFQSLVHSGLLYSPPEKHSRPEASNSPIY